MSFHGRREAPHTPAQRIRRATVCVLAGLLAPAALAAPTLSSLDFGASWRFDDNLGNGFTPDEENAAHVLRIDAASTSRPVDAENGTLLQAVFGLESVPEYTELDRFDAGLHFSHLLRAGDGYDALQLSLEGGVTGLLHRDSDFRDRLRLDLALVGQLRPTDRVALNAGYGVAVERAREEQVYNTFRQRLFLRADYRLDRDLTLWLDAEGATGDVVASGTISQIASLQAATRTAEDVFGVGRVAYRMDADSLSFGGGLAWQPSGDFALELGAEHHDIEAEDDLGYERTIWSATGIWRLR